MTADPRRGGRLCEPGLLLEWLADRDVAGLQVAVTGRRDLTREVAGELTRRGARVTWLGVPQPDVPELTGRHDLVLDAGLAGGLPGGVRPTAGRAVATLVRPGGRLVVVAELGGDARAELGRLRPLDLAPLREAGLRLDTYEEFQAPDPGPASHRMVRVVLRRPECRDHGHGTLSP